MTLSGYFMSKSLFGQHFLTQNVWLSKIIAWKVTKIVWCYQRQKCSPMTLVSGNIFISIRKCLSDYCRQTGVGGGNRRICSFPDAISSYVSEIMSTLLHITTTIRSGFLLTPIRMTLNDLECPIHLKVRLADDTLDVHSIGLCCGFQSWPRVTECTWALTVSDINVANEL